MKTFYFKTISYVDLEPCTEYGVITAKSFIEVMNFITDYYENDLECVEIFETGEDFPLINAETYQKKKDDSVW